MASGCGGGTRTGSSTSGEDGSVGHGGALPPAALLRAARRHLRRRLLHRRRRRRRHRAALQGEVLGGSPGRGGADHAAHVLLGAMEGGERRGSPLHPDARGSQAGIGTPVRCLLFCFFLIGCLSKITYSLLCNYGITASLVI